MKQKFYHCSPKRFKKGDRLICPPTIKERNFYCDHIAVYIHTSVVPHCTIWGSLTNKWHVYEVSPIGKIYHGTWNDIICESAIVLKRVGNAKGILDNYKAHVKIKDNFYAGCTSKSWIDDRQFRQLKKRVY